MVHEKIKELLPDYLKGILQDEIRSDIERHIAGCPDCTHELAVISELVEIEAPDPGPLFWDTLPQKIRAHADEAGCSRPRNWFFRPVPIALMASFLALSFFLYLQTVIQPVGLRSQAASELDTNGDEEITEISEELAGETNGSEDEIEACSAELAYLDINELDALCTILEEPQRHEDTERNDS